MSIDQQYVYPLSLQMGAVTGAVDDLMHGYEQLVQTLPKISDNVKKVHFNTESMAKELEQRTRQIVEGYEYLEGISSSIPSALTSVAEGNRKAILDSVQMNDLFNGFQTKDGDFQKQLNNLKAELNSITQERVVNLVFSREVINDAKRMKSSRSATPLHLRSNKTNLQVNKLEKGNMNSLPSHKLKINTPTQSILIPEYIPPEKRTSKAKSSSTVRYVDSSLMVPSMRQGSLPNEIKNIKTTPGMQPVFITSTQQRPLSRTKRQPSQLKSIANKLEKTEADISQLKDQILLTAKRSDTEKEKSVDKLKVIVENLEKKQHARDEAVVASVQKLMKGTVECISEHLNASRNDFFDDSYQGYRILTVTPKKESPSSSSAVPKNLSRQSPPPKPSTPPNLVVEQQSNTSSSNEYYDYAATKAVVYQLEGDHDSGVRWMKSTVYNENTRDQFNSSSSTAMLLQPSNLVNEANYFVYNSRNGRTIVSATQPIPVHRHGNAASIEDRDQSNVIESLGLEDRLDIITLEGQAADDKYSTSQRSWPSDEQQIPSRMHYDAGDETDTMRAKVMDYPQPNILIDHKDAFDFSNVRRDPLLRSRVKAVFKNKAVEDLNPETNVTSDLPEKACVPAEPPSELAVSFNSVAPTPAPSINSSLLELIHSLVQSQREDAKETQNMLFTLLQSREEKDHTTGRDSSIDPDELTGFIEPSSGVNIPSTEEPDVDDVHSEPTVEKNEEVDVKHEENPILEADRESEKFRTSLGAILHEKASENQNVLRDLRIVPQVSAQETPASVSIPLIEIVRAVGLLQQQAPPLPQQPFDKDFVQRTVSEGVASGVKEALQMMMLNLPPAPSRHVVRIGESLGGLDQPRVVKHSTVGYDDRERDAQAAYATPRYFREYAPPVDREKEDLDNSDSESRMISSRPSISNNAKSMAMTRSAFGQNDIEKDIAASRSATEKLLLSDDSSSWESFSLDRPSELTALLENKDIGDDDRSNDSGSISSSIAGNQKQKILYRNVATKDIVEAFGEGINPNLVTDTTGNRMKGEKNATKRGGEFRLKPLVSTVLEHSATDAVMELYDMDPPSFDSMASSVVLDESSDPEDSFVKSSANERDRILNDDLQTKNESDHDTDELSTTLSSQDMNRDLDSRSSGSRGEDVSNAADGMMFELLKTLKLRHAKESVSNRRSSSSRFDARSNASSGSLSGSSTSSRSKIGHQDDNRSIESILVGRVGARNSSDSSSDSDMDRGRHNRPSANNFLFLR